ncbi:MAG: MFS transporter [Bacteroidetes bacterium B1(2017)]|nr:MAG: MFS transporter [Bacteroidetes bacterium B1(2017)]
MSTSKNQTPLYTLAVVFFFWGFVAASNGIFIPFCKSHFHLSQYESQLIDASFYAAYFFGSFFLYLFSQLNKHDILNKIGYKSGIVYGMVASVIGAGLLSIFSGSETVTFGMILGAFFIIALGFSLQQTSANPFVVALGPVETGTHRLNFTGGVNSLGTLLGPIVVSLVIFGAVGSGVEASLGSIQTLYLILAGLFALVALFFFVNKSLPKVTADEEIENSSKATTTLAIIAIPTAILLFLNNFLPKAISDNFIFICLITIVGILLYTLNASKKNPNGWGAMHYPQLVLGMLGIFTYVGVEVTIQSNMGALLKLPEFGGYDESNISNFISLYWGSLMIGRWTGAISAFEVSANTRKILTFVVPFVAFGLILGVNHLSGNAIGELIPYALCIIIAVTAFFIGNEKPAKTLLLFAGIGIAGMLIGLLTTGTIALFAFISGGLACSIMWPSIFSLSISGLGKYSSQGASFLIMMILGGAIIPPIQGKIADSMGIHISYFIPVLCFMYLAFFALRAKAILKSQGINVDDIQAAGGH